MDDESPIGFGDKVRVRDTQVTRALGVAGLTGQVFGETTPSVTGVEVVGTPGADYAINVSFDGRDDAPWFTADLLEFVDHAPGTNIQIGDAEFVREEDGQWRDVSNNSADLGSSGRADKRRPWWRFW